jgi:hypothetical protein
MKPLHSPAKKKESCEVSRNSLVTMLRKEHLFCLSFYYSPSQKTSVSKSFSLRTGLFSRFSSPL